MSYTQRPVVILWGVKVTQRAFQIWWSFGVFTFLSFFFFVLSFFWPVFVWKQYAILSYLLPTYSIPYMRFWFKSSIAYLCLSVKMVRINTYFYIQDWFFLTLLRQLISTNFSAPLKSHMRIFINHAISLIIAIIYKIDFTPSYRQLQQSYWHRSLLQWTDPPQ